ncbi:universal stress protein [Maribacter halichondriae]|uniref:universal stress protein n=1 Tax=Maribacter halichondriae TaxID=2980554 RepID=UPI002359C63E|nr:universal stress protein [Maribacter sp. Hal144]
MDKISTILVPFDSSTAARTAFDYAVNFVGDDKNMEICLAYVEDDEKIDITKAFDDLQKKYAKELKKPLQLFTRKGSLSKALSQIQENQKIDLVIMGTSEVEDHEIKLISNTSKFVSEVDSPVLVIPEKMNEFQIKNIALVLGKEEIDDRHALETLLDVARKFNAKVHVLTIENTSEMYGYSEADQTNENLLEYYLENFYSEHTFIENPDVVKGILSHASEKEMDMIAILPRNHAKKSNPSEGRLTEMLTLKSKIPVLAID